MFKEALMKKIIPFLTLFILFGNMVSCEQVSTETNYYKPNIKEEYKEISKDEFVNKVNSNYKSGPGCALPDRSLLPEA